MVCFNPLRERGPERFQHPQKPIEMLANRDAPTHSLYLRPNLGGDLAVLRGIAKYLLQWEREALGSGGPAVFDRDFIAEHTHAVDAYLEAIDATPWAQIEQQSGLERDAIGQAAAIYREAGRTIVCWAMGITQHHHSVATIRRSPTC